MSSSDPLMLSITFISVGILFFFVGLLIFKWKRLIEDIPTSKIRSIAMGLVEIFGEVVSSKDNIMKSPLSQSGCVYYRYLIEEYRSSGKSSHWIPIKKGWDCQLFYLKDDTGMVLINPRKAKVDIPVDIRLESGFRKDPPEYVKSFLKQNNIKYEGLLGANKTMRYTEHLIEPEDKLFIIGTATDNPHIEEATAVKGVQDVMITKGKYNKFYYISDRTEKKVLKTFRLRINICLAAGFLLIILGSIAFVL